MPPSRSAWRLGLSHALTALLVLFVGLASFRPLVSRIPAMLFFEDDFFYYLKVAQNLAHGAGSTFNGIVATNGYHPLWFLLLTAISFVTARPHAILVFVASTLFLCIVAIYLLTRRLLTLSGVDLLLASALAIYAAVYSMHVLFGGMEVTLTVPLILLVVLLARNPSLLAQSPSLLSTESSLRKTDPSLPPEASPVTPIRPPTSSAKTFALLGLAASAMILSRLDTLLLAALIFLSVLAHQDLRRRLTLPALAGLTLGLLPVLLYFASNLLLFHTLLPISGAAKQLKTNLLPSAPAWISAYDRPLSQLVNLIPILLALALLLLPRKRAAATGPASLSPRLSSLDRAVYLPVLAFPFLYIALLSCRSDWQLWGWYLYGFRAAFCVSLIVLCAVPPVRSFLNRSLVAALLTLFVLTRLPGLHWNIFGREAIYEAALDLQNFALTHPGVYAMGDRSGMVGYLLPDPVVQTEGLMMDRTFLDAIRQQQPLLPVLARYHVRYYIGTTQHPLPATGCFEAVEPIQAGPASPHMRAQFCQPPVATFFHRGYYTLVYDLAQPSS